MRACTRHCKWWVRRQWSKHAASWGEGAITLTSHGCTVSYCLHRVVFPTPLHDATADTDNAENFICFANYLISLHLADWWCLLADHNVHFITTCNHKLLMFTASAVGESEERAGISLDTGLDCGAVVTDHSDPPPCTTPWWRMLWVEMRVTWVVVLFVSCWGHACHKQSKALNKQSASALCLLRGDSMYVHVWYRATFGCYDVVRWSHLRSISWYHLIYMITK